jgi:hypothetical protein
MDKGKRKHLRNQPARKNHGGMRKSEAGLPVAPLPSFFI